MYPRMQLMVLTALLIMSGQATLCVQAADNVWQAGVARVVITPEKPVWLSGYGNRDRPAEGKVHDLYARAAVIRDPDGHTVAFLSLDLIGVSPEMSDVVFNALSRRYGLARSDIMLASSHTHCGPAIDHELSHMLAMTDDDWAAVRDNQQTLNQKLVDVSLAAFDDLQPASLSVGSGTAGFAVNRRPPIGEGPIDHDVPVLRIATADGTTTRGIVFGYACHNTTLSFYQWCGDYAGFAQLDLESQHQDCVAMFFSGCGADQNPLPRRTVELCQKYGRLLATGVNEVLSSDMKPVTGRLVTGRETVELEFQSVPSRKQIEERLANGNRFEKNRAKYQLDKLERDGEISRTYPFPVQLWQLGREVTWVALGGEVVVDYSLRLKRELGPDRTWVTGYANDVMCYIPSERILKEGGYEGGSSMLYYQLPSAWKPGLEEKIVAAVHRLRGPHR